jgi:NitT/TauT family transport system ATP-binding protein
MTGNNDIVLSVRRVHHQYGENRVLHDVNIEVARGQFVALVGPSGCGKSTLFNHILGILPQTSGEIVMVNQGHSYIVERPGADRGIVFQKYSLIPFLTALENVAFGLLLAESTIPERMLARLNPWASWHKRRREHLERAEALLVRFGLQDVLHQIPDMLSGGQQQRVAIAQAVIMEPALLMLDEPLGAIDPGRREYVQRMILELYDENVKAVRETGTALRTVILVTHATEEALFVGDRVVGLSQYWDWKAEGHEECPGATVVYDKKAPVYSATDPFNVEDVVTQRDEIYELVHRIGASTSRGPHVTFWDDMAVDPDGHGVAR